MRATALLSTAEEKLSLVPAIIAADKRLQRVLPRASVTKWTATAWLAAEGTAGAGGGEIDAHSLWAGPYVTTISKTCNE